MRNSIERDKRGKRMWIGRRREELREQGRITKEKFPEPKKKEDKVVI